jgi:hypothetical protein
MLLLCTVLMFTYFFLFVHIFRGNKNKWLMFISMCLVLSNLFTIMMVLYASKLFIKDDISELNIVLMCLGNSGANFFFNYSHLLLAYKYRKIQRTVPWRLKNLEPPPETNRQRATYYILLTICYLGPVIQIPASIWFRSTDMNVKELIPKPTVSAFQTNLLNCSWYLCGISDISSGVILVRSVIRIRRFFVDENAKESINLPEMIRHATAFGLYMISSIIRYGTHTLHTIQP